MTLSLQYIGTRKWAILGEYLSLMAAIADRDVDTQKFWGELIEREFGGPVAGTREGRVRNGVGILPITGPMFRYANLFTAISGATSYEQVAVEIGAMMANPEVRHLILDVNSPGGEVDGAAELADLIYSYRGEKPMTSYISHLGASAGYWVASAADEVVANETSMLGSIGAVIGVTDYSKMDEAEGIRRMEFVSAQSPNKRVDPFSEDKGEAERAKAVLQGLVDRLGAVFIEKVSAYRGMSEEAVMATKGGLLIGTDAVEAGLADRVGTLEGLIEEFSGAGESAGSVPMSFSAGGLRPHEEVATMDGTTQTSTPAAEAPEITRAYLEANHSDILEEVRSDAASEERDRILGIHAVDAAGFDELKRKMMEDPNATIGDAALAILGAKGEREKRRAQAVADGMEQDEGDLADVGSATLPGQEEETEEALAASVIQYLPV
jgi:signal peptide peptidase SppA